ncbi:ribosome biogenesis GTPase Der [Oscillospiraceae bacterium 21-37]|jgi:GTP-binding protein|uniref:ribosome biogenesis GTPase Der n=1 Tax=Eubacteriales TaxID=186802 RepID=UPI00136F08AF|nr:MULTISPECIES: ribosome biogenesis GTPase Der [unclassified Neglectibacter]MCI9116123.1 ribosome biogenesis GTPase Der [Acutalibacter sp.]NBI18356.1 ribosome biogenesis GTPase Der [Neglectibacter sp. 59]NBJ74030.1 ribosome biogenesis GTPase Der [Neglectibacter sp. X4]NCE81870.1 ribosome biogenesis GTPase Der [Neglectibacter sp. X58]
MAKPIVAIVGRPNVGKSTLFNKIVGKRLSIVEDTPGVTRDRVFGDTEWCGKAFSMVDTGGIEPASKDVLLTQMREQAQIAIDSASAIIFVTDVRTGVTATDADVGDMLQKSGIPVVLCVNKCDSVGEPPVEFYEFYNLGLGDPVMVSSVHGHGTGDLLDRVCENLPETVEEDEEGDIVKVAVIGKPNVGKSSLVNKVSGENRCIVSDMAGTTRDAVDTTIQNQFGTFTFIDTAGLRRKSKVEDAIEHYSNLRAEMAVERADVCLILIDAQVGFTEQDSKVAGIAHEAGKACIVCVNKWDAVEKDDKTMGEMRQKLEQDFSFMSYAPILFISAKTGQRLDKMFALIKAAAANNAMRVPTGVLNDILAQATARVQPPTDKGKRLKIFYMTQASTKPPTFVCFVNDHELFHFSYQRYLENRIRETFGLEGTPIRLVVRERGEQK